MIHGWIRHYFHNQVLSAWSILYLNILSLCDIIIWIWLLNDIIISKMPQFFVYFLISWAIGFMDIVILVSLHFLVIKRCSCTDGNCTILKQITFKYRRIVFFQSFSIIMYNPNNLYDYNWKQTKSLYLTHLLVKIC